MRTGANGTVTWVVVHHDADESLQVNSGEVRVDAKTDFLSALNKAVSGVEKELLTSTGVSSIRISFTQEPKESAKVSAPSAK